MARYLLTSLSPLASYSLGNALSVGAASDTNAGAEEGGCVGFDHASTLLYPPSAQLIRLRDSKFLRHHADGDTSRAHANADRWYSLYTSGTKLSFREIEAARSDFDSTCIFDVDFNATPSCLAVDTFANNGCENIRCLSGFSNGIILHFNPFSEQFKEVAANLHNNEDSSIDPSSVPTPAADRPFQTAPGAPANYPASAVTCVAWVPAVASDSSLSSSAPLTLNPFPIAPPQPAAPYQFICGMSDGRLLLFDTRIEKESLLEQPYPVLSKLDLKAKKKDHEARVKAAEKLLPKTAPPSAAAAVPPVWQKEFMNVVRAPMTTAGPSSISASTVTSPTASLANMHMNQSVFSPAGASQSSTTPPPTYASNPCVSWKFYAPNSFLPSINPPHNVPSFAKAACTPPVSILAMQFSISGQYLALSISSGHLIVLHYASEKVLGVFRSNYGNILCIEWFTSLEAPYEFIITGGEDDKVCIWDVLGNSGVATPMSPSSPSPSSSTPSPPCGLGCVMVGEGHVNFVSRVQVVPMQFIDKCLAAQRDLHHQHPHAPPPSQQQQSKSATASSSSSSSMSSPRADTFVWDEIYRFTSVGQDQLLLFWQFSHATLVEALNAARANLEKKTQPNAAATSEDKKHSRTQTIVIERPTSPMPVLPTTVTVASLAATSVSDILSLFVPFPPRYSLQTLYPMAKNHVSDRAIRVLDNGFDLARKFEELQIFQRAANTIGAPLPEYKQISVVPPEDDVILTMCHGYHIKLWSRIPTDPSEQLNSTSAPSSSQRNPSDASSLPSASSESVWSPQRQDSLTSRTRRINTPVIASKVTANTKHGPGATAAAAAAVGRRPRQ